MRHLARRVDAEERARRRRALEIEGMNIAAKRTHPDTALVVHGQVVQAEQRLPFPFGEDIPQLVGLLVPLRQRQTRHQDAAARVQGDAADKLPVRY